MPYGQHDRLREALSRQTNRRVTEIFRRLERVGKGAYGSVYKGEHIETGIVVALKIVDLDQPDDDIDDIRKEVALLSDLHQPESANITSYYGCWLDGARVWIAMDFAHGGSIRTLMKACKGGIIEERYVVLIIREVLVALSFLHRTGVVHRDLKAANVLLTANGNIMLCDFGVSARLNHNQSKRSTFIGTPYWMAPEVIQQSPYDTKADIWSLGITLYEMVVGAPPHAKEDQMRALLIIPKAKAPRLPENVGSKDMRDFVASVLREQPADRPTADELYHSKWIKNAQKAKLSILRELIAQYGAWLNQGGTRASLAGDVPWENQEELPDEFDVNPWEFDTVRGSISGSLSSDQSNEELTPVVERPQIQAPPSLRGLFNYDNPSEHLTSQPIRTIAIPPLGTSDPGSSVARVEIPVLEQVDSPQFFDPTNMHTARPDDFSFPRRTHEPSVSSISRAQDPGRQRDVERPQRSPSISGSVADSDKDLTAPNRRIFNEKDRREPSPQRTRRPGGSPGAFTFPAVPPARASPLSNSSPTLLPQAPEPLSGHSNHTPRASSDEAHGNSSLNAPPLSRSRSASPYVPQDNTSFVRPPPPRPQPARQQSASALEPPARARPYRSASTSTQENSNSTLAVPQPSGLRQALNISLVTDGGLNVDMLPPSPSAVSPMHRQFTTGPSNLASSLISEGARETGDGLYSRSSEDSGTPFRPNSRSPPRQGTSNGVRGPTIRPLDYSLLGTSESVHAELSQTVAELSQWLEVIDHGLTGILAPGDVVEYILDQHTNEPVAIQSDP